MSRFFLPIVFLSAIAFGQESPPPLSAYSYPLSAWVDTNGPNVTGYPWLQRQEVGAVMDFIATPPADLALHPLLRPDYGPFLSRFHKARVESALDHMETHAAPADGVRLYKMYSSGWIVKGPGYTFAVDFDDGPFAPDPVFAPSLEPLPLDTLDELASVLDAYFVTHIHADHISPYLIQQMLALGKPVIVTQQIQDWAVYLGAQNAMNLIVPPPGVEISLGPLTFVTFSGVQYFAYTDGPNGPQPILDSPLNVENNSYLFRLNNVVIAHFGDNDEPGVVPWVADCHAAGWNVDVALNLGSMASDVVDICQPPLRMLSHEWEFRHVSTGFLQLQIGIAPNPNRRVLFWGEHIDVTGSSAN